MNLSNLNILGMSRARADVVRLGCAEFDEAALTLRIGGERVALDRRPLELLRLLLARAGQVVTKDECLATVWPGRVVTENSLTKAVARLRAALRDDGQLVRTVHGYGYRLVVESRMPASLPADRDEGELREALAVLLGGLLAGLGAPAGAPERFDGVVARCSAELAGLVARRGSRP